MCFLLTGDIFNINLRKYVKLEIQPCGFGSRIRDMEQILNRFIEFNFSVWCMVWLWCCVFQSGLPVKLLLRYWIMWIKKRFFFSYLISNSMPTRWAITDLIYRWTFRLLFISFGKQKWHCGMNWTLSAKVYAHYKVFGL